MLEGVNRSLFGLTARIRNTTILKPMGRPGNDPLDKVAELIDPQLGSWDMEVVRNNFLAPDAYAILNIL